MLIAQITDTHVVARGKRVRERWDTGAALERAVARLADLRRAPDIVIFTGDLVDDGRPESYRHFRERIAGLGPPFLAIPGNHDSREALAAAFPELTWHAEATGFRQVDWRFPGRRVLGLDTLIPGETRGELCQRRLDWLAARLAEDPETPVLIALHHPPFAARIPFMDAYGLAGREALGALLADHPQVVRLICGHLHRPVAASVGGRPVTCCPGTSLQVPLWQAEGFPPDLVDEPAAIHLHDWRDPWSVLTHTLYVRPREPWNETDPT